ncbi:UNKNOWN [Stylonychia lemnae]|uniref:Uncharacterized protein n=1 Tax=Stylonychia lemnae TaxID=5949 RepID=A0A078A9P0_STYLE|nr:UNKNOWN [Stylonychia lemnae]|eukprot:CDW78990.1 UNKNOWN [Stylonychia lemnae]
MNQMIGLTNPFIQKTVKIIRTNFHSKLQKITSKLDPQQQSTALKTEKETQKSKSISKLTDQDYQQDSVMKEKVRQKVNSKSYDSSDKSIEENKSQFQSRNSYNNPKRLNSQEDKQSQVNNPYDKSFEHSQSFKHQNDLSMENKGFQLSNQNYERRKSLQNADTNLQKIELPINQIVKESYIVASQQDNQKELNKSIEKYITASSLHQFM